MRWVLALLLAGCGRIGFEATSGDDVIDDGGVVGDGMQQEQEADAGTVVGSPSFVSSAEASAATGAALNVDLTGVMFGDVILVSVGWRSGTSSVVSVNDNNGALYASQGAVTRSNNQVSQQLYATTSAGVLTTPKITVTMSLPAPSLSVRALVYRGVTLAGSGSAQGSTATATAPVSPLTAGAIVVGSNTALAMATSPCPSCTTRLTTAYGDLVVERVFPTAGGIQSVSVGLAGSAAWVMGQVELDPQ